MCLRTAWLLALGLTACGASGVTRGADLYAGGHYIEAAEVFEHTEARLANYNAAERARYGLYRGAALLSLGDVPRGARWLEYAKERAGALSGEERRMLNRALDVATARSVEAPALAGGAPIATAR